VKTNEQTIAVALGQAHVALLRDLRELEEATRIPSKENLPALRDRLWATQAHLVEHFRLEEQNGYMDAVRKREPRFERTIQQLAEEHGQLKESLNALIRETEKVKSWDNALREAIHEWIERVRSHEARETDLVQDAFNLDIGAED
jgi:uncharacterized coiled-coil DUF342 family protein